VTSVGEPVVFVVDDDDSFRDSLRRLLASAGFSVEAFPTAQAFLGAPRPAAPACLVLDVYLPGPSGLDLQRELTKRDTALPIIFLTGRGDIPMSVRAIKAGAVEFLTKPFRRQDLLVAVEQALERDRTEGTQRRELTKMRHRFALLTMRERDVLERVSAGLLNKQIAAEFGTREVTVKEQRAQVMRKMGASSLADLVRIAARLEIYRNSNGRTLPR
jgi:FixJ family two-component response regulator